MPEQRRAGQPVLYILVSLPRVEELELVKVFSLSWKWRVRVSFCLASFTSLTEQSQEECQDFVDLVGPVNRRPKTFREVNLRLSCGKTRFPMLSLLSAAINVWPTRTACMERGFSLLNRLKTKKRLSMDEESLTDCMTICSNGVELEQWSEGDAVRAITTWSEMGPGTRHV